MGAALSIFVLLSFSVFVVRVAAVALRITGLSNASARFQALSAYTGTGFTTSEAESIVNYPLRRRIVSLLMIIGNLGLVTVLATLVASLVQTDGDVNSIVTQIVWLLAGLALLWILMLNRLADRLLCAGIARLLNALTFLGKRRFHRLLQLGQGRSVCEHSLPAEFSGDTPARLKPLLQQRGLILLALQTADGEWIEPRGSRDKLRPNDRLILYGPDRAHEDLAAVTTAV